MKKRILGIILCLVMCLSLVPTAILTTDAAELPELQNVRLSSDGVLTFDPVITTETSKVIYEYNVTRTKPTGGASGGPQKAETTFNVKEFIDSHDWGEGTYTVSVAANTDYRDSAFKPLTKMWKGTYLYYSDTDRDLGVWVNGQQFTMGNAKTGIPCGSGKATLDTTTSPFTLVLDNAVINNEYRWTNNGIVYYCGIFGNSFAPEGTPDINIKVIGNCSINVSEKTGLYTENNGIFFNGSVNIFGDGSLAINVGNSDKRASGIYTPHISVKDVTLKIDSAGLALGWGSISASAAFDNAELTLRGADCVYDGSSKVTFTGYAPEKIFVSGNKDGSGATMWNGTVSTLYKSKYLSASTAIPFEIYGTPSVGNTITAGASCSDDLWCDLDDGKIVPYQGNQYGRWILTSADGTETVLTPTANDEYDITLKIQQSWIGSTIRAEFQRVDGKKYVSDSVTVIRRVSSSTFTINGLDYEIIDTHHGYIAKLTGPANLSGKVEIPAEIFTGDRMWIPVTSIKDGLFIGNSNVTAVIMPDSVTDIGTNPAFVNCTGLKELRLSDNLAKFNSNSLNSCTNLEKVNIPACWTEIPSGMFFGCVGLKELTIPGNIQVIPNGLLRGCRGLEKVTIESGVKEIGAEAFYQCKKLESINIPDGVTTIGANAFYQCESCHDWGDTVDGTLVLPDTLTSIGAHAFDTCGALKQVTIPTGITEIPASAFNNDQYLRKITIPASVTDVGDNAFNGVAYFAGKLTVEYTGTAEQWLALISDEHCGTGNEKLKNANPTFIPDTFYGVYVNGVQFDNINSVLGIPCGSGKAYLDVSKTPYVITLDNATITTAFEHDKSFSGIYGNSHLAGSVGNCDIKLIGDNVIDMPAIDLPVGPGAAYTNYGINFNGTVNISGPGSLSIAVGDAEGSVFGIHAYELNLKYMTLTINSPKYAIGFFSSAGKFTLENVNAALSGGKELFPTDYMLKNATRDDLVKMFKNYFFSDIDLSTDASGDGAAAWDGNLETLRAAKYLRAHSDIVIDRLDFTFDWDGFTSFVAGESGDTVDHQIVFDGLIGGSTKAYTVVYNMAWPLHYERNAYVLPHNQSEKLIEDREYYVCFVAYAKDGYALPHDYTDIREVTLNGEPVTPKKMEYDHMAGRPTYLRVYLSVGTPAPATTYDVWVNGEQFAGDKLTIPCGTGTATYDPETNTVTLNNAQITNACNTGAIRANGALTVNVAGNSSITLDSSIHAHGIFADGNLTLTGPGNLDIRVESDYDGLETIAGNVVIAGSGDVTVNAGAYGVYTGEEGYLNITGSGDVDIYGEWNGAYGDAFQLLLNGTGKTVKLSGGYKAFNDEDGDSIAAGFNVSKYEVTGDPASTSVVYTRNALGDVNGDGSVNDADLTALLRHVAKIELLGNTSNADVNGDGIINAADVTALAQMLNP